MGDSVRVAEIPEEHRKLLRQLEGGAAVPGDFECDGCTCSPDWWPPGPWTRWVLGTGAIVPIYLACVVHDFEYPEKPDPKTGVDRWGVAPGTHDDRLRSDQRLYRNLLAMERLLPRTFDRLSPVQWAAYRAYCRVVYRRVRLWGLDAYTFAEGHEPHGLKIRAALFINRYALLSEV